MKILNIVDEFHPEAGYENNILSKFMIKKGYQYEILTSEFLPNKKYYMDFLGLENIQQKDFIFEKNTGVKITRLKNKHFVSGRAIWNYKRFMNVVNTIDPDVLFFCGNDSFIFSVFVLKNKKKILNNKMKYKIIADSHMLDMASKNRFRNLFYFFYKRFVTPIIKEANIKVIRVQYDFFVEKRLGIPLSQAPFISFGTDTILFHPDEIIMLQQRKLLGISNDSFVIIYAGKINESKGGMFFAEAIKKRIVGKAPVVFLVLANAKTDYEKMVLNKLNESENRVIINNAVPYCKLNDYYKCADLAIFPKQCSLSFYDVQACGVPVLLENNNINIERTSHKNGFVFESNNIDSFRKEIVFIANLETFDEYKNNSLSFIKEHYDYDKISEEYDKIFKSL